MAGLSIIFAGSGEFGVPSLSALLGSEHRLALVISQPDRPAGRGKHVLPTPIAQFAVQRNLPLLRTANINQEKLPPADLILVVAFGQKISQEQIDHPRLGTVNLHASLLPKYRGAAPINWTIIRGETHTGNTIFRLAQKMDAGAILSQSHLHIGDQETAGELHDRLAEDGARLVMGTLVSLADGTAAETPQSDAAATLAPKLSREHAQLNFHHYAADLARQIRGLYPWPGCRVRVIEGEGTERGRLTLARAREDKAADAPPGTIMDGDVVAAGHSTALEILEVQPEGKRPMTLAAYRNGHPWERGMRLESI